MPKITILGKTNLQEDSWHSMVISSLRGSAALVVALAHLRSQFYPGFATVAKPPLLFEGLAFGAGFSYLAVIVFFVLSGWLVGGSFLNKLDSDRAFQNYTIDRISRLWVVLVPTFLVVLLAGAATGGLNPGHVSFSTSEPYSASAFLGNMIGLQTIVVPEFGGNFPLWSLANETWYYVLFLCWCWCFAAGRSRRVPRPCWRSPPSSIWCTAPFSFTFRSGCWALRFRG
jgi:peptidoglycan/LPS O-acetylase OafA/YrhL